MHDPTFSDDTASPVRSLRDRLGGNAEERLGRALSELLESPLFTGAIGRAFDAREKAAQAQEVALGALNLPSAADIERLTRRIRSLSQRLEAIEDGVERLDTSRLAERRAPAELEARLERVEQQLDGLLGKLDLLLSAYPAGRPSQPAQPSHAAASPRPQGRRKPKARRAAARKAAAEGRRRAQSEAARPPAPRKAKPKAAARARPQPKAARRRAQTRRPKPPARARRTSARDGRAAHRFGALAAASWSPMRSRAPRSSKVSETTSTHPTAIPRAGAEGEQRGGLHLDRERLRRPPRGRRRRRGPR